MHVRTHTPQPREHTRTDNHTCAHALARAHTQVMGTKLGFFCHELQKPLPHTSAPVFALDAI